MVSPVIVSHHTTLVPFLWGEVLEEMPPWMGGGEMINQ
jgi:hypothetical protein